MMNEYDGTYRCQSYEPEDITLLSDRFLVESAWVCPYKYDNEEVKKPPDPADASSTDKEDDKPPDPEQAGLEYRLHLKLRAQCLQQNGRETDKPIEFIHGLTVGNDWSYNSYDGSWNVHGRSI